MKKITAIACTLLLGAFMAAPVLCGAKTNDVTVKKKPASELVKYDESASFTYSPISIAAVDVIDTADLLVEPVIVITTSDVTLKSLVVIRERELLPDVRCTVKRSYKRVSKDNLLSCRLDHSPDTGYVPRC